MTQFKSKVQEALIALVRGDTDLEELSGLVLEAALESTQSDHGFVSTIDPATGDNVSHSHTEMLGDSRKEGSHVVFSRSADGTYAGLWGVALNTGKPFLSNNPGSEKVSTDTPQGHSPISNILSVPIKVNGAVRGEIALANRSSDYTQTEVLEIQFLADLFASALLRMDQDTAQKSMVKKAVSGQKLSEALLQLHKIRDAPSKELVERVGEAGAICTGSEYSFVALINEEENRLTVDSWPSPVIKKCDVLDKVVVYNIEKSAVWTECIRNKKPIIIQDYQSDYVGSNASQLPTDHVEVRNYLGVPVSHESGEVKFLISVANKTGPYESSDEVALELLGQTMLEIVEYQRRGAAEEAAVHRFEASFTNSPSGMCIVGLDGRFLHVNEALEKILGMSEAELVQKTFQDIIHPDDLKIYLDVLDKMLSGEISHYTIKKRYFHSTGKTVYGTLAIGLVRDAKGEPQYFVSHIEDRTDRQRLLEENSQAYRQLEAGEQRFRLALENAAVPIMLHDEAGKVHQLSKAWSDISGYTLAEIGTVAAWVNRAYPDRNPTNLGFPENLYSLEGGKYNGVREVCTASGAIRTWEFWSAPLGRLMEGQRAVISTAVDITEKLKAQIDLEKHAEELERFAYGMAHDLKAPVRAVKQLIVMAVEDIEEGSIASGTSLLKKAESRSSHMLALIDGILRYSKLGSTVGNFIDVEPCQYIKEVSGRINLPESFQVLCACSKTKRFTVRICETRVEQVVANLMQNAADHHDKESGVITIRCEESKLTWKMQISDDGPGILEEDHERIFAPFKSLNPNRTGSGLGLAIAKKAVGGCGGTICIVQQEARGATFEVVWPKY